MCIRRLWEVRSLLGRAIGVGRKVRKTDPGWEGRIDQGIGPSTVNYPPPEGKKPDAVHTLQTTKESAHLYRYVIPLSSCNREMLTSQTQRRLQSAARNARTRPEDGIWRCYNARALLMELRLPWSFANAWGQRSCKYQGVPSEVCGAGEAWG